MYNNNCVEEPTHKVRLFSVTIKGRVIKEEQILPNGGKADRIAIEHEYDQWGGHTGLRSSLGAEQNTSYTPLGETETLHARQSEESDAWESRIRYDERGREIERFAMGGVRITSEYDFAGRLEARCTYAGTESRGHRFYAWRRNDRLLSMRSHLRKSPNGAYVLGENVTPSQGVTLVQDWLKA